MDMSQTNLIEIEQQMLNSTVNKKSASGSGNVG